MRDKRAQSIFLSYYPRFLSFFFDFHRIARERVSSLSEKTKKGLINQIKNLFPLLIPLIICSIKRAFNVAEALESRGFGSRKERSYYYTIKYSIKDWIFTFYLILFLAFSIFVRVQFNLLPEILTWSLPV